MKTQFPMLVVFTFWMPAVMAVPIQSLPDLVSISVFERSSIGGPDLRLFLAGATEMRERRVGLLSAGNSDFSTVVNEFYDVFYSDADGTVNEFGEYLTVEARFDNPLDAGHNLAEAILNFGGGGTENAAFVSSFQALGPFALPALVGRAVDGDLDTHTFMGSTDPASDKRLRVTVGFQSSVGAVPAPGKEPWACWLQA